MNPREGAYDFAMTTPFRPTREQLLAANDVSIPDLIAPDLDVLFCGINPGLYSGATGHHFARPGNRFWPALHAGGFTPHVVSPFNERELLSFGCGITNVVNRTTATAAELSDAELCKGGKRLERTVKKFKPKIVAVLGLGAYRTAFARKVAVTGLQDHFIGETKMWILPNPSGLNAHHTPTSLGQLFGDLNHFVKTMIR